MRRFCVRRGHFYFARVDGAVDIDVVPWEAVFEASRPGAAAKNA